MMMMCNPVRDHGPADWHRDVSATFHGPLQAFVDDVLENGPRYVQWNIPLYDDNVLWVVPKSHRRINTPEEDRQLAADPKVPLPGSISTELRAGDGVVYVQPMLHWASNYGRTLRRTIHGGFCLWSRYPDLGFTEYLSHSARATFDGWAQRSMRMQDLTESALRAAMAGDAAAYARALEGLQPGIGRAGKNLLTVYLSKVARNIRDRRRPDFGSLPAAKRQQVANGLTVTLNWGPQFADRFSWSGGPSNYGGASSPWIPASKPTKRNHRPVCSRRLRDTTPRNCRPKSASNGSSPAGFRAMSTRTVEFLGMTRWPSGQ